MEQLTEAKVTPRHSADHWVPAAEKIADAIEAAPGQVPGDEASPAGLEVARLLIEEAAPYVTPTSRAVFTKAEKKLIETTAGQVGAIRKAIDGVARIKTERDAAHEYGVGAGPADASADTCKKAIDKIVTSRGKYPALWNLAHLTDADLEPLKKVQVAVGRIARAKKSRLKKRKLKAEDALQATLALETWCDWLLVEVGHRMADGELKGDLLAAARPEEQQRKAKRTTAPTGDGTETTQAATKGSKKKGKGRRGKKAAPKDGSENGDPGTPPTPPPAGGAAP